MKKNVRFIIEQTFYEPEGSGIAMNLAG